ncbi:hypothetical protein QVD17_38285 [Tagetes erecta]|uniref:Uncharacterized protein n=1 Tax=Tagetes erecta TaxID=13708 RepID=A0AAD8NJA6_TARER|nr:hypothetical protein QVD17_38285 [Tagetes erecta]
MGYVVRALEGRPVRVSPSVSRVENSCQALACYAIRAGGPMVLRVAPRTARPAYKKGCNPPSLLAQLLSLSRTSLGARRGSARVKNGDHQSVAQLKIGDRRGNGLSFSISLGRESGWEPDGKAGWRYPDSTRDVLGEMVAGLNTRN